MFFLGKILQFTKRVLTHENCLETCMQTGNLQNRKLNALRAYENESIFRTFGAVGMSINNELEKKEIRLLASRLDGTSIADSFTVSNRWSLLICLENNRVMHEHHPELIIRSAKS